MTPYYPGKACIEQLDEWSAVLSKTLHELRDAIVYEDERKRIFDRYNTRPRGPRYRHANAKYEEAQKRLLAALEATNELLGE